MFSIILQQNFDVGLIRSSPWFLHLSKKVNRLLKYPKLFPISPPHSLHPIHPPWIEIYYVQYFSSISNFNNRHWTSPFTVDNSFVVLRWTKCTPQSDHIDYKLDPHEDPAWRQLSRLLNWILCLILVKSIFGYKNITIELRDKCWLINGMPINFYGWQNPSDYLYWGHLILCMIK